MPLHRTPAPAPEPDPVIGGVAVHRAVPEGIGRRAPARSAATRDPEVSDPCTGCGAWCCKTLVFNRGLPGDASQLEFLRYCLGFPGVEVGVAADSWAVIVRTTCRHLEDNRCSVFGTDERPAEVRLLRRAQLWLPGAFRRRPARRHRADQPRSVPPGGGFDRVRRPGPHRGHTADRRATRPARRGRAGRGWRFAFTHCAVTHCAFTHCGRHEPAHGGTRIMSALPDPISRTIRLSRGSADLSSQERRMLCPPSSQLSIFLYSTPSPVTNLPAVSVGIGSGVAALGVPRPWAAQVRSCCTSIRRPGTAGATSVC